VLSEAAPNDKSEMSCQLDLKLTYQPGEKNRGSEDRTCFPWVFESVRGGTPPKCLTGIPILTIEFAV
jgi:hypothetical protein